MANFAGFCMQKYAEKNMWFKTRRERVRDTFVDFPRALACEFTASSSSSSIRSRMIFLAARSLYVNRSLRLPSRVASTLLCCHPRPLQRASSNCSTQVDDGSPPTRLNAIAPATLVTPSIAGSRQQHLPSRASYVAFMHPAVPCRLRILRTKN